MNQINFALKLIQNTLIGRVMLNRRRIMVSYETLGLIQNKSSANRIILLLFRTEDSFYLFFVLSSRLADVYCPILILHDRSDEIISFALGKKVGNGDRIYQSEKYDLPRNEINKKLWLCGSEDRGAQMVSWRPRFEACRSLQKPEVLQASLLSLQ